MPSSRRGFLFNAGTALSGGVLTRFAGADGELLTTEADGSTTESRSSAATSTSESSTSEVSSALDVAPDEFNAEFKLDPGERRTWDFNFDTAMRLRYDLIMRWGPEQPGVDIYLFDDTEEFRAYLSDERARFVANGTYFGTANLYRATVVVPPGSYHIAVDNNDWDDGFGHPIGESNEIDDVTEVPSPGPPPSPGQPHSSDGRKAIGIDFEFEATPTQ